MKVVVFCVLVGLFAGIVVATGDGPGFPGEGNHPPGVGHHPPGVGRNGPAWSKWRAYKALQAWKKAITDDPNGILHTWVGPDVCNYTGVFCSPPQDPELSYLEVVAGIDLNGADLKGCLVPDLGLLREIGLFHLNTNRFFGSVPDTFKHMVTLFELDLSNNRLSGTFPEVVLQIPKLGFLDIRFNKFHGKLPKGLFSKPLDAIFVNDNNFAGKLPDTFGCSNSSAIVLANNNLHGSIPKSISNLKDTLQEIVALNNNFHGKLPSDIGDLENVHLFDYSNNRIKGGLPSSIKHMSALETFDMSKNKLSGKVNAQLCSLDHLQSVVLDDNYFNRVDPSCARLGNILSLKGNCLPNFPAQKSQATCAAFYPPPPPPPCPKGYKLGRNSKTCFQLVKEPKKWDDAEFYCRQQSGGHLAAVADWDELHDVGYMCSKINNASCYLGGRKPKVHSPSTGWSYPWSPCVNFTHSFWNKGQPDNKGQCENCLSIHSEDKLLNDVSCDIELPFICALKRCDHAGCDVSETCKTMGDKWATCSTDWGKAVGYKCQCSEGYKEDNAGTCIRSNHNN